MGVDSFWRERRNEVAGARAKSLVPHVTGLTFQISTELNTLRRTHVRDVCQVASVSHRETRHDSSYFPLRLVDGVVP